MGAHGFTIDMIANVVPIPWRTISLPRKLKFGYFIDNGFAAPIAPVANAVQSAVDALTRAGHEVVPFPLFDVAATIQSGVSPCQLQGSSGLLPLMSIVIVPNLSRISRPNL